MTIRTPISFYTEFSSIILYCIPIKQVNLKSIPNDINPTDILSGSSQQFSCTTDEGRPSSRIQWYMAGVNITDDAIVQADTCNPGCNNRVISSSVLIYTGHITDNGKTIYCTAFNIDAEGVRSQYRAINILFLQMHEDSIYNTAVEHSNSEVYETELIEPR
ncbi:unnamed protein product [Mytilus coruscus]|uniref:Ig-like domain-containing protein n=1 Tax=Mytilus coruscus TaxID=42192 RepID=A0A6J8EGW1_MYTCO|nr:unnamed protein product [Mytilus coruscus]